MGTASKLSVLLTSPLPLFYPFRPSLILRLARHSNKLSISSSSSSYSKRTYRFSLNSRNHRLGVSINASESNQTQTLITEDDEVNSLGFSLNSSGSNSWPEWTKLVQNLSLTGYFNQQQWNLDEFEGLPDEFVRAANACLSFARERFDLLRLLSRKDIEVIVENGSPLLFKSAVDSEKRIKTFFDSNGGYDLEFQKECMVDLMRFLLSYAYNLSTASEHFNLKNKELVESSVRHLLRELGDASRADQLSELSNPLQKQFPEKHEQIPRLLGQKVEMKRGDWICQKCKFTNFSKNMKCLECDEARPKRQLTGGEWECPQCDFYNYGRNAVCLRCDCKCPREVILSPSSSLEAEASNTSGFNRSSSGNPDIMPLRKGVNRFVVSTKKPPLERSLTNYQSEGNISHDSTIGRSGFGAGDGEELPNTSDTSVSQSLDRILGRKSSIPETNSGRLKDTVSNSASPSFRQSDGSKSNYVPFVPLPADMFAKPQKLEKDQQLVDNKSDTVKSVEQRSSSPVEKSGDDLRLSEKPVTQAEVKDDKEQTEKSERWFKKVAELHDVTDLASAISDEDFPEIMPMRKGENRFVVSKKKDRSLTSPLHKRRAAMEQATNTNFVPFVPFPPDYFAKKDKPVDSPETESSKEKSKESTSSVNESKIVSEKSEETNPRVSNYGATSYSTDKPENQRSSIGSSRSAEKSLEQPKGSEAQRHGYPPNNNGESLISSSSKENRSSRSDSAPSPVGRSSIRDLSEKTQSNGGSLGRGFTGKSLEGSLVKEPDPLDMSEEAKAERWFRRAAQIKDISELSQIPDEDFPQIMPMRKGVNRFVVSKRKTPLERRLTSPQYRRNLPVSSEPLKKEEKD